MAANKFFQQELFKFSIFPKYQSCIDDLATNLADPEEWDFSDDKRKSHSILKNYLEHIFRKLRAENKICFTANNEYCCFNTGLVTKNLEEIFAFFFKNKNQGEGVPPYVFKCFCKKSDGALLRTFKSSLPKIADFFQKPEDLLFNPNCELIPDIDHIIQDNLSRFPAAMQGSGDAEIRRRLEGAIDEARKKVRTNYKTAVPQFYGNRIQLLLPLCLTPNSPNPDLALVVHKIENNTYTTRTCLTLKMAYNNARLIVKPQSTWLKP